MDSPYIFIEPDAWDRMWAYVMAVETEIGGFGYGKLHEDSNIYVIDKLFIVPQEVSRGEVDYINEGLAFAVQKAIEDDRVDDLRVQWHSHANMGLTFSSTDKDGIAKIGTGGLPYLINVLVNRKYEIKGRVDVFGVPLVGHAYMENVGIDKRRDPTMIVEVKNEIDELVSEIKPDPPKTTGNTQSGSSSAPGGGTTTTEKKPWHTSASDIRRSSERQQHPGIENPDREFLGFLLPEGWTVDDITALSTDDKERPLVADKAGEVLTLVDGKGWMKWEDAVDHDYKLMMKEQTEQTHRNNGNGNKGKRGSRRGQKEASKS